jgi:TRAP-type C4-dicarboxylate transport system substrate-binding protein
MSYAYASKILGSPCTKGEAMMKRRIGTAIGGLVLGAALFNGATAIAQQATVLTLGTGNPDGTALTNVTTQVFKPALAKHSNGRLDLKIHFNGSLCSEQACGEQVRLGQIDVGQVSTGNMGAFGPSFVIVDLPFVFKDPASSEKVVNGWLAKEMRKRVAADTDFFLAALTPAGGFRHLDNKTRQVRVPDDLKGIKIRVTKSPIEFSLIKAWGGVAVPYDWPQLYQGLQTGVVEGMYIPDPYF